MWGWGAGSSIIKHSGQSIVTKKVRSQQRQEGSEIDNLGGKHSRKRLTFQKEQRPEERTILL